MKLYDSEIKVMNVLWERGSLKASEIVKIMQNLTDWNKNTTYTQRTGVFVCPDNR